jgi:cell division protein FtsB
VKWLALSLFVALVVLQHRIWISDAGVRELHRLETSVADQKGQNDRLNERNRQLAGEVRDLKGGMSALEERARSELGMIADHETFFQVVRPQWGGVSQPQVRTAAAR